jgi:hypothetical protein
VNAQLDVWLCDFGGLKWDELAVNGGHFPDDPCFNPQLGLVLTPATDIFSLGSLSFVVLTGNLPFGSDLKGEPFDDVQSYQVHVNGRFATGEFPVVAGLVAGDMIRKCWQHNEDSGFKTKADVLSALRSHFPGEH